MADRALADNGTVPCQASPAMLAGLGRRKGCLTALASLVVTARRLPALAVCVATALAACASESDAGGGGTGGDTTVSAYLTRLPAADADDPIIVTYADIARAADIGGLDRPEDLDDQRAVGDFLMQLGGQRQQEGDTARVAALVPQAAQLGRGTSDLQGFVDDVGWTILEVDAFAERDTPPRRVTLLDGSFDPDRLEETLDDAGDGTWVAGDPDGDRDLDGITPARPIGESLWLSLDGDRLTVTWDHDDMPTARAADGGDGTLAGDATLAALGAALDDRDVYSALLLRDDGLLSSVEARMMGERMTPAEIEDIDLTGCEGMVGAAIGVADDGEPLLVLALGHVDEDAADRNADVVAEVLEDGDELRTRRPWSEILTVESVDTDGTVVVVTARPADMALAQWYGFISNRSFPPC